MPRLTTNVYFPYPQVQIKLEGDWQKVTTATSGIGHAIQMGYDKAVNRFSTKLLMILREAIQNGGPPGSIWEPHAESTKRQYASHGWVVGQPYYRTGLLYNSLNVYSYGGRIYIGLPTNYRTARGLTLVQLMRVLEAGTENIPARPLFSPSLQEAGGTSEIKRQVLKSIRQELSGLGFRANQVKF